MLVMGIMQSDKSLNKDVRVFFFSSRRRHTRWPRDWSSDVCSSDLRKRSGRGAFRSGARQAGRAPRPRRAARPRVVPEAGSVSRLLDLMCLIVLAWRTHPGYRLIVAANRDEYFGRPAAPAGFWDDHANVLAGRDLEAGGTWLGITLDGRFAALTNYRNPADKKTSAPSRGALVADFLTGRMSSREYVPLVEKRAADYNGFSLLVGDAGSMFFFSNRGGRAARVAPGVHGLSNHLLDTPWPKVEKAKAGLLALLEGAFDFEAAFGLLNDT